MIGPPTQLLPELIIMPLFFDTEIKIGRERKFDTYVEFPDSSLIIKVINLRILLS